MSSETEQPEPKNYHQETYAKVTAALKAWEDTDDADRSPGRWGEASDLQDRLMDEDLQILPRVIGADRYRVLIDGQPAPYPGQERPAGPMDANDAAEAFLLAAKAAEDDKVDRVIEVRPATGDEMVYKLFGDVQSRPEPVVVDAESLITVADRTTRKAELRFVTTDGREVHVRMSFDQAEIVAEQIELSIGEDDDLDDEASAALGGGA